MEHKLFSYYDQILSHLGKDVSKWRKHGKSLKDLDKMSDEYILIPYGAKSTKKSRRGRGNGHTLDIANACSKYTERQHTERQRQRQRGRDNGPTLNVVDCKYSYITKEDAEKLVKKTMSADEVEEINSAFSGTIRKYRLLQRSVHRGGHFLLDFKHAT